MLHQSVHATMLGFTWLWNKRRYQYCQIAISETFEGLSQRFSPNDTENHAFQRFIDCAAFSDRRSYNGHDQRSFLSHLLTLTGTIGVDFDRASDITKKSTCVIVARHC